MMEADLISETSCLHKECSEETLRAIDLYLKQPIVVGGPTILIKSLHKEYPDYEYFQLMDLVASELVEGNKLTLARIFIQNNLLTLLESRTPYYQTMSKVLDLSVYNTFSQDVVSLSRTLSKYFFVGGIIYMVRDMSRRDIHNRLHVILLFAVCYQIVVLAFYGNASYVRYVSVILVPLHLAGMVQVRQLLSIARKR